jgi:3D (Asp-Asp-Asp) domain-containing protein
VDPKVIPIGSWVYVPGYGKAIAGDTGSSILGRHIDLGFPDDQPLPHWYQWVDVYLLTPAPPRDNVRYVLPNWPQER